MLAAYFDESYNQRTEKNPHDTLVYTVGGWLSTVEQWKRFGKQWKSVLKSAGIEFFHMTDYESRFGDYEGWNEPKRKGVLKRLHRIIKDHTIYGCTATVTCANYDELIMPDLRPVFGKRYYGFDALACVQLMNEWCDKHGYGYEDKIHYVFADLAKQGGDLDRIFRRALSQPETKKRLRLTGTWTKGIMKDVTQLQSADIIAYEINKRAVNDIGMGEPYLRKSLANLHLHENFEAKFFGRSDLVKLVSDYRRGAIETY